MGKTILLLSLSTFRDHPDRKDEYTIERENKFTYRDRNGETIEVSGYYQMEPVPNLLKKMGVYLDEVIMLSTEKTKRPVCLCTADDVVEISPEEYFIDWIGKNFRTGDGNPTKCRAVGIDEKNPAPAISDIVDILNESRESGNISLYVDTHGGFRSNQLLLEAVINLWQNDGISLEVFNVQFSQGKYNTIDRDEAIRIFDFVSGIKEFMNYGRINSLLTFLNEDGNESILGTDKEFLDPLREISEGIQWCSISTFTEGLRHLKNYFRKNRAEVSNPYLRMFKDRIREDFGNLLQEDKIDDTVVTVRWCMKKGFFQQALTLIESRMPDTMVRRGIIRITDQGRKYMNENPIYGGRTCMDFADMYNGSTLKYYNWLKYWSGDINKESDRKGFNEIFRDADVDIKARSKRILEMVGKRRVLNCEELIGESEDYYKYVDRKCEEQCKKVLTYSMEDQRQTRRDEYARKIVLLSFMHRTIKEIRNTSNHAIEKTAYNISSVHNAIYYYLDLIEEISLGLWEQR